MEITLRSTRRIDTRSPFNDLYGIDLITLKAIEDNMRDKGFDKTRPITLWDQGNVVIDGHARLQAAKNVGIDLVWVGFKEFKDDADALEYAEHHQRNRRNTSFESTWRKFKKVDQENVGGKGENNTSINTTQPIDNIEDKENLLTCRDTGSDVSCGENNTSINTTQPIDNIEDSKTIPSHIRKAKEMKVSPAQFQKLRLIESVGKDVLADIVATGADSVYAVAKAAKKSKIKNPALEARKQLEKGQKKLIKIAMKKNISFAEIKGVKIYKVVDVQKMTNDPLDLPKPYKEIDFSKTKELSGEVFHVILIDQ